MSAGRTKAKPRPLTDQRSVNDKHEGMGRLIRLRRVEKKLSQAELGEKLGVSFQQIQKYEKGLNRVDSARLDQIAQVLDVPITFFFDQKTKAAKEVESLLFTDAPFTLRLLRAYNKIEDQTVQRQFVALLETVAGVINDL